MRKVVVERTCAWVQAEGLWALTRSIKALLQAAVLPKLPRWLVVDLHGPHRVVEGDVDPDYGLFVDEVLADPSPDNDKHWVV